METVWILSYTESDGERTIFGVYKDENLANSAMNTELFPLLREFFKSEEQMVDELNPEIKEFKLITTLKQH